MAKSEGSTLPQASVRTSVKASLAIGGGLFLLGLLGLFGVFATFSESDFEPSNYFLWSGESADTESFDFQPNSGYIVLLKNGTADPDDVVVSVKGDAIFDEFVICSNVSREAGMCDFGYDISYTVLGKISQPTSCPCTLTIDAPVGSEVAVFNDSEYEAADYNLIGIGFLGCSLFGGGVAFLIVGFILWAVLDDESDMALVVPAGAVMGVAPTAPIPGVVQVVAPVAAFVPVAAVAPVATVQHPATPQAAMETQTVMVAQPIVAQPVVVQPAAAESATVQGLGGTEIGKTRDVVLDNRAREYYDSLLGQGFDAATAASHAMQHFPGFQP